MSVAALEPAAWQWKRNLHQDRIEQQWPRLAARLQRRWRRLTAEDVLADDGNAARLARILQQRYGMNHREAMLQVYEFESEL